MIDLTAPQGKEQKLPVIWNTFISGLLSGSSKVDMALTVKGINQSFAQSPYVQATK